MKAKRATVIALIFFLQLLVSIPTFASLTPHHFGTYTGIDRIAVARGAPLEKSLLSLTLNHNGVILSLGEDATGRNWRVRYTHEWFINEGLTMSAKIRSLISTNRCAGIRQHKDSPLVKFILCFKKFKMFFPSGTPEVSMIEGGSQVVGLFYMNNADGTPPTEKLSQLYEQLGRRAKPVFKNDKINSINSDHPVASFAQTHDFEQLRQTMRSDLVSNKLRALGNIEAAMWISQEEFIDEYLSLIQLGLQDANLAVQAAALDLLTTARVVHAVPLVNGMLAKPEVLQERILRKAVAAASRLVDEANWQNQKRAALENLFGTSDLSEIFQLTQGIVEAEHQELIGELMREIRPSRQWTLEHQVHLLTALAKVAVNESLPSPSRDLAIQSIMNSWLPKSLKTTSICARLLAGGERRLRLVSNE